MLKGISSLEPKKERRGRRKRGGRGERENEDLKDTALVMA